MTAEQDKSLRIRRARGDIGIKDIAAAAGVSVATVSRVVNGHRFVSSDVRERVQEAITRLAYRPNIVARSLRTQQSASLGVVVPNIGNAHFTDAVRAMQDEAELHGYTILVVNSDNKREREEAALRNLLERQVDGVALVSASSKPTPALSAILASGIPVVAMDRRIREPRLDHVTVDTRQGTRDAVLHLAAQGCKRIAFIAGPPGLSTAMEKRRGYRDGLRLSGIDYDPGLVFPGDYSFAGGERQVAALLDRRPRPEAVVVANNLMALGAMRTLLRRGIVLPRDLALFGYDDTVWTDVIRPTVSVVSQPTAEMGRETVRLLCRRLAQPASDQLRGDVILPTALVLRETTEDRQ